MNIFKETSKYLWMGIHSLSSLTRDGTLSEGLQKRSKWLVHMVSCAAIYLGYITIFIIVITYYSFDKCVYTIIQGAIHNLLPF